MMPAATVGHFNDALDSPDLIISSRRCIITPEQPRRKQQQDGRPKSLEAYGETKRRETLNDQFWLEAGGNQNAEDCKIFQKCLSPLLLLMKLSGLYYDETGKYKSLNSLSKIYSCTSNVLVILLFISICADIGMATSIVQYYMRTVTLLCIMKSAIQVTIIMRLCRKKFIWTFIEQLESFIVDIVISNCPNQQRKGRQIIKKSRIFLVKLILTILVYVGAFTIMVLKYPDNIIHKSLEKDYLPPASRVLLTIPFISGWILPLALFIILCKALTYTFKGFYDALRYHQASKGLCCKKYIKGIRQSYLRLTMLCDDFDDMFSLMLMCSYLIDVVLVCLQLRLMLFTYTDMISRLMIAIYLFFPLVSLVFLSASTSKLFEVGQKIRCFVQGLQVDVIDLDTKVELDLLLFHIGSDPVVVTIWKMIPLNRSIIVSIFISIVTYLTMLLSFL